jgi:hypothetical protein
VHLQTKSGEVPKAQVDWNALRLVSEEAIPEKET